MKRIFVALGIVIALFCGAITIGHMTTSEEAGAIEQTITVEESTTNYLTKHHPDSAIEDVTVHRVEEDENYGGWRVDASYTIDGEYGYASINSGVMDEFVF